MVRGTGTDSGRGTPCYDYCVSPAIYIDDRGHFTRQDQAASDGIGICRSVSKRQWEIIPCRGADCGFRLPSAKAVALDKDGREMAPAAFCAVVGKENGSDFGDGILYKLAVVDTSGAKTIVAEKTIPRHAWLPIEADLSKWAGQRVRFDLITDAGPQGNAAADWACWAEMRVELRLDNFERQGRQRADEIADLASRAVLFGSRGLQVGIGHQIAFQLRLRLGRVAAEDERQPMWGP